MRSMLTSTESVHLLAIHSTHLPAFLNCTMKSTHALAEGQVLLVLQPLSNSVYTAQHRHRSSNILPEDNTIVGTTCMRPTR